MKRRPRADFAKVVRLLRGHYGLSKKVWNKDPFTVLIGTILSQRTRDEQTAEASRALFSRFDTPRKLARANVKEVERLIRPAGFYRVKARQIKKVARTLLERFDGNVPEDMEDLLSLPSVGRKTANCVLVYGFNRKAIPVDTHVHRISNRLGWVRTRTPEETEERLVDILPKRYWLEINDLLVTHGQNICKPIGPRCSECPINNICAKRISDRERAPTRRKRTRGKRRS
jgi:endonuclease-3